MFDIKIMFLKKNHLEACKLSYELVKLHELTQQLVISHKGEWATQKITLECGHVAQTTTNHSPLHDMNLAYAWLLD
jgi:hypothetical protein